MGPELPAWHRDDWRGHRRRVCSHPAAASLASAANPNHHLLDRDSGGYWPLTRPAEETSNILIRMEFLVPVGVGSSKARALDLLKS